LRQRIIEFAVLAVIASLTLLPGRPSPIEPPGFFCVLCGDVGAPDVILNVLLFVPLGVVLRQAGVRLWVAIAIGFVLSLGIEAAQLIIPNRTSSLRDVVTNTLGAGLGALLPGVLRAILGSTHRALILLWSAVAGAALVVTGGGLMLRFAPPPGQYFAHWSPRQGHLEEWSGSVTEFSLNGTRLPFGPIADATTVRTALGAEWTAVVHGVGGAPTERIGGIVSLSDEAMEELLLIGPLGDDLVVRTRRRASALRFHTPSYRFHDLLAAATPGTAFRLEVQATWNGACASLNGVRQCVAAPAAGSAWTLLLSSLEAAAPTHALLSALTLLALSLPVGLVLLRVPILHAVLGVVALAGGIAVGADLAGLAAPEPWEWLAVVTGLVSAALLGRRISGRAEQANSAI